VNDDPVRADDSHDTSMVNNTPLLLSITEKMQRMVAPIMDTLLQKLPRPRSLMQKTEWEKVGNSMK